MKNYRIFLSLALVLVLGVAWYTLGNSGRAQQHLAGSTMGTHWRASFVSDLRGAALAELETELSTAMERVNQRMSTYLEDSELSGINRAGPTRWVKVSDEMLELLRRGQQLARESGGAFDISVGPLVNLWGFGPTGELLRMPSDAEIAGAMGQVGYDKVELDVEGRRVRLAAPMFLDFSALAKGYAVDRATEVLERAGIHDYLVELGGEIGVRGRNGRGELWRIGIEDPNFEGIHATFALADAGGAVGIATSGDYRNLYEMDGQRLSHIIDPRTGRPVTHHLTSVTVIARDCFTADGLATLLSVLGPEEGLAFAAERGIKAHFILRREGGNLKALATRSFENGVRAL